MRPKILLLADVTSSHTEKWALALADRHYSIGIFSLNRSVEKWYDKNENIILLCEPAYYTNSSALKIKLKYFLKLPRLHKIIKSFKPDIVHAHYATSYGLLGALSGFHPFVLSVWGSDVFEFPRKSIFHKLLFKLNLKCSDKLLSTSFAMKKELEFYTNANIEVTPFGVDTGVFYPKEVKTDEEKKILHLGIIKSLEERYGINDIIKAVQILKSTRHDIKFKVLFVGNGSKANHYRQLVRDQNLSDTISFIGKIPTEKVPYYHNLLDIYLNVSNIKESFGVSVLESMACAKPVIVTNAPGLIEIVKPNLGIIIKMNDPLELANAIKMLIEDPQLRSKLGEEALSYVKANYELKDCVNIVSGIYESVLIEKYESEFRFKLLRMVFA